MAKEDEIVRVFDETTRALGPITHFVHSAGVGGKNSRLDAAHAATLREVLASTCSARSSARAKRCAACRRRMAGRAARSCCLSSIASVTGGATEYVFYAAAKSGDAPSPTVWHARWRRKAFA